MMVTPSVFYMPNLERCNQEKCNIIGTDEFLSHQFDLNVIWHRIEQQPAISRSIDVELKNMMHFLATSEIDFDSSIQMTFNFISIRLDVSIQTFNTNFLFVVSNQRKKLFCNFVCR